LVLSCHFLLSALANIHAVHTGMGHLASCVGTMPCFAIFCSLEQNVAEVVVQLQ